MTDEQYLGLEANIEALEAGDLLEQARRGDIRLDHKGWYQLTLAATGSKERAEQAAYDYLMQCALEGKRP